jgi:hypothetical protein
MVIQESEEQSSNWMSVVGYRLVWFFASVVV